MAPRAPTLPVTTTSLTVALWGTPLERAFTSSQKLLLTASTLRSEWGARLQRPATPGSACPWTIWRTPTPLQSRQTQRLKRKNTSSRNHRTPPLLLASSSDAGISPSRQRCWAAHSPGHQRGRTVCCLRKALWRILNSAQFTTSCPARSQKK